MIKAGTTIKWTHPDNGEHYLFPVKDAEDHGRGHWTITLNDNRKLEIWEYEICADDPVKITEDQINPEPEYIETRTGALPF